LEGQQWSGGRMQNANDDKPANRGREGPSQQPRSKRAPPRAFDMWLQKQLRSMYDAIACESLPDDLLNLTDKDAATRR
jgi:hypothetical protein